MGLRDRALALEKLRARLLDQADHVVSTLSAHTDASRAELLLTDVLASAEVLDYWRISAEELFTPRAPTESGTDGLRATVVRAPRGNVVVVVGEDAASLLALLRVVAPAFAGGNTVLLLPTGQGARRCASLLVELASAALPAVSHPALSLYAGDTLEAATQADMFVVVGFDVGKENERELERRAATTLVVREPDGAGRVGAAIVDADAPIERAARGVAWGAFAHTPLRAPVRRVFVHADVFDAFESALRRVCPEPSQSRIANAETNDPNALELERVAAADDACAKLNEETRALSVSIWSRDLARARSLADRLDNVSLVTINDQSIGETAFLTLFGPLLVDTFTRRKLIAEAPRYARTPVAWYPHGGQLAVLTDALVASRTGNVLSRLRAWMTVLITLPQRWLEQRRASSGARR